eukprot:GHUV01045273.1.p1 GENE.GHUV01045273.1~~GHUV01045273.1.p1  ORF type:complete len:109 (-),score=31.93 GHUV01045273.1:68-394(-)
MLAQVPNTTPAVSICCPPMQVLLADTPQLEHQLAEPYSRLLAALQKSSKFDYILAPSTTFGKNLLPRAAALLDVQPVADIIQVVNNPVAEVSAEDCWPAGWACCMFIC